MPDGTPVEPTPVAAPEPAPEGFKPIESQDELNRILAENKRNLRAELEQMKAEVEALRPKALKADELEAAQMTELQRVQAEAEQAKTALAEMQAREKAAARRIAQNDAALAAVKELGYPSADKALKLASYLEGETPEDLVAAAKTLFEDFKPENSPLPAAVHDVKPGDPRAADGFARGILGLES